MLLIRGIRMPVNCQTCPFVRRSHYEIDAIGDLIIDLWCGLTNKPAEDAARERNSDCPLVEFPASVRIIDRKETIKEMKAVERMFETALEHSDEMDERAVWKGRLQELRTVKSWIKGLPAIEEEKR